MGCCFSARIKADSPPLSVANSSSNRKEEDGLSGLNSNVSTLSMRPNPRTEDEILQSSNLKSFSFSELRTATRNFRLDIMVGEGAFGRVFKGWIDEQSLAPARMGSGIAVAVKFLNQEGFMGHREWLTEINFLGQLHHPNLVKLIGYCLEGNHRLLVYEFFTERSLDNHLFRGGSHVEPLPWSIRVKVALDVAKCLAFLHRDEVNVIKRDFKTSHVLLDMNYNAKLSGFELAKDGPAGDESHVSTRVMGTYGYAAPEYVMTGHLTKKSDVYSYGVVLLEILSGRRTFDKNKPAREQNLVDWAKPLLSSKRRIFQVMDVRIEGQYTVREAMKVANIAIQCLSADPKLRPTMADVVRALEKLQNSNDTCTQTQAAGEAVGMNL